MDWQNDIFGLVIATVLTAALLLPLSMVLFNATAAKERENVSEKKQRLLAGAVDDVKPDAVSKESNSAASEPTAPRASSLGQAQVVDETNATNNTNAATPDTKNSVNTNNWRCACDGGFLPPGMFGNMEAVLKMGAGQCYHKQL
jgi:hypothetical protein